MRKWRLRTTSCDLDNSGHRSPSPPPHEAPVTQGLESLRAGTAPPRPAGRGSAGQPLGCQRRFGSFLCWVGTRGLRSLQQVDLWLRDSRKAGGDRDETGRQVGWMPVPSASGSPLGLPGPHAQGSLGASQPWLDGLRHARGLDLVSDSREHELTLSVEYQLCWTPAEPGDQEPGCRAYDSSSTGGHRLGLGTLG